MQINWKLRLANKTTLFGILSALVIFVYSVAQALGLDLPVAQETIMAAVSAILAVLAALGVIVDPTTHGLSDSERAMSYEVPRRD